MIARAVLIFVCAVASTACAATHEYMVELPAELQRMAGGAAVTHARIAIAIPDAPPDTQLPVLVVNATSDAGHQSSRRLLEAYAPVALGRSWIVVAADPASPVPAEKDGAALRFALDNAALSALRKVRPAAADAALAFAGFSGGAKYSGWLAAAFAKQGRTVIGVFQSGINEDTIVDAAGQFGILDGAFRKTPVFLQSGADDTVATPEDHRRVMASLKRAGFENVRMETVPGGHQVATGSLREGLEWFAAWKTPILPRHTGATRPSPLANRTDWALNPRPLALERKEVPNGNVHP